MEIKRISDLFWMFSPNLFFASIILGVMTGLCHSVLIPFIVYASGAVSPESSGLGVQDLSLFDSPTAHMARIFLFMLVAILVIKSVSQMLSVYIAQRASVQHRVSLYHRINAMSYESLEKIGHARLINLLNIDIPSLTNAATMMPVIWISLVTIIGMLGYLIYIDMQVFLVVLVCIFIAVITYQLPIFIGVRYFARSREHYDRIQEGVSGLIYGFSELKLSKEKSAQYIKKQLVETEDLYLKEGIKGHSVFIVAETYGEILCFLVIAIVIFHLPYVFDIPPSDLLGIVMVLLYLSGPVGVILNAFSQLKEGNVALKKIQGYYPDLIPEKVVVQDDVNDEWASYRLSNIGFGYQGSDDAFALNDINLEFMRGSISFIVGGNGSGKSTLSRILSLHYHATEGDLWLDGQKITPHNMASVRENISAIYTNFYVFPEIYGQPDMSLAERYLKRLELDEKVEIVNNTFSTVSLSDGQRKRLALLALLLDDRPICIFDEWAADQDPRFRHIFYHEILPELKAQNKVVIVISHDDRYFDQADMLVVMESGSVRSISPQIDSLEGFSAC